MKQRARVWAIVIGTALVPLSYGVARAEPPATPDSDSDVARAEHQASAAFEAYGRGAYAEAVALYEQAYAATPGADIILYNIARIYDLGLRDRARAIQYYTRYATSPSASPERTEKVRRLIADLTDATATSTDGATSSGPPVALDALSPEADAPQPPPLPAPAPALPAPMTPAADLPSSGAWSPLEVTALALGGIGIAAVGIGVGFGLSANAQSAIWQRDCEGNVCASQRGLAAAKSAASKAHVATAGFVTGTALIAVASVLWVVAPSDEDTSSEAMLSLTPVAGPSEVGGVVSGRF